MSILFRHACVYIDISIERVIHTILFLKTGTYAQHSLPLVWMHPITLSHSPSVLGSAFSLLHLLILFYLFLTDTYIVYFLWRLFCWSS